MRKIVSICLSVLLLLCLSSCVSERIDGDSGFQRSNAEVNPKFQFPKIKDYKIVLEPVTTRRVFYAGENESIIFRLKNTGKKTLNIYEWRLKQPENIKIYYAPYSKTLKTLSDKRWQCVEPEWHNKRSTLTLKSGNAVLITKELSFIKKLNPNEIGKKGRTYLLYAELNLTSIDARSLVMKIKVR